MKAKAKAAAIPAQDDRLGWAMALFALATIATVILAIATVPKWMARPSPPAMSTVKLSFAQGHGSGVYIGNGLILTAAHVVDGQKKLAVKTSESEHGDAEVMWAAKEFDVALLRLIRPLKLAASRVSCDDPAVGTAVRMIGNPAYDEFVVFRGVVAATSGPRYDVRSMMVLDMAVAPGVSGGPILDNEGNVVGIINAMIGFSIGYGVPGKTLCMLLGRA